MLVVMVNAVQAVYVTKLIQDAELVLNSVLNVKVAKNIVEMPMVHLENQQQQIVQIVLSQLVILNHVRTTSEDVVTMVIVMKTVVVSLVKVLIV